MVSACKKRLRELLAEVDEKTFNEITAKLFVDVTKYDAVVVERETSKKEKGKDRGKKIVLKEPTLA